MQLSACCMIMQRIFVEPSAGHCRCQMLTGRGMMAAVADVNKLRQTYPALRYGWSNCIHEDRANGIMG
jgi:hypothetical protein